MGIYCAPYVAVFLRDFMLSLSDNNQSDVIKPFISTSRYLDDLIIILILNKMFSQIYSKTLQIN